MVPELEAILLFLFSMLRMFATQSIGMVLAQYVKSEVMTVCLPILFFLVCISLLPPNVPASVVYLSADARTYGTWIT